MKFFKSMLGQKEPKRPEPPKWDIKPPTERPAPKKRMTPAELPAGAQKDKEKSIWDDALDTIQLEQEDLPGVDDPYQTCGWQMDPENDTRRLRTIQIGEATDKAVEGQHNPYDTGSHRRSWKK